MTPQRFEQLLRACEVHAQARVNLWNYRVYNNLAFLPWVESRLEAILSPVTRLPPEILTEIFRLVAELDPPRCAFAEDEGHSYWYRSMGWISLSQVNRRWRYLCLGTPDLWAPYITLHPGVTELFLERAGHSTPLTIDIEPNNPLAFDADFARLVSTKLIERVRKLVWCTPDAPIIRMLLDALQGEASLTLLDFLHIEKRGSREEYLFRQNYGVGHIDLPNATDVGLHDCFVPFSAPRLVSLDLSMLPIACAHLFDTLRRCPNLEFLELVEGIFYGDLTGCAPVALPRLRCFEFIGFADEDTLPGVYSYILRQLILPASAFLSLDLNDRPGDPEEFDHFVPAVRSLWRADPPSGLKIGHRGHPDGALIEFFSGVSHDPTKPHYESWAADFWKAERRAEFRVADSANGLARAIHTGLDIRAELAAIVYLSAEMEAFDLEGWVRIFRALPNLRTLQLIRESVEDESDCDEGGSDGGEMGAARADEAVDVFTALGVPLAVAYGSSDTSSASAAPLLPRLNNLWLTQYGKEHGTHGRFVLKHLAAAVRKRAELRAPALTSLRLDLVDEPREEEGEAGGWGDKCVLSRLVESVRWRGR
ncbi:unnamed protein product [Peniophora sp. CBMAI 1063]|nr:unnamed protein product [Peniophora sp. CBMAI 1063]